MRKLKVLVLFDSAGTPPEDQDWTEQFKQEDWFTEAAVVETLEILGHQVKPLGIYDDIGILLEEVKKNRPDVVFNLTELFLGKAYMDKNIPSLLELLRIPYTGCGPTALMMCNDKGLTKKILTFHRVKVPGFRIFQKDKKIWHPKKLRFPMIVKPSKEEASTGISQASYVENDRDMEERIKFIHEKYNMPAIAEEYIEGRELYVSVMGTRRLQIFPFREVKFKEVPDDEPKMATYKAKWDMDYRKKWGISNEFAGRLPDGAPERIASVCKRAYRALHLDSYGRFDMRLTPEGDIYILEANANPELARGDEFAEAVEKSGMDYNQLIEKLLKLAFQRET